MVNTRSVRAGNQAQPLRQGQEGGDENRPHNSAHNSASTHNQGDVVTTQLAAMQQQFGVFQLVLAQLLARNNPVQHAPALSESQGQSHVAPVQQPLPDDVTRRLDSLEKLVVEQQGASPPHHNTDSIPHPLNTNITLEPYPAGFKIPQLETYDGMKDPDDHLHAFYSCMQAQNASDALMCKIFLSTLRVLEVSSFNQAVGIAAIIQSLQHERFRDSLIKHHVATFNEKANEDSPESRSDVDLHIEIQKAKLSTPQQITNKAPVTWTPFNLSRLQIFMWIKNKMDLRRPGSMRSFAATRDHTRYCAFIKITGVHQTLCIFTVLRVSDWIQLCCRVVKMASFFNAVIGRPTLTEIRAVVSQSRLCMKFPTSIGIATLRASRNERLSLLDAYSGYHQVPMAPKDEEKIQRLTGRVVALHRFILKLADKCLQFFKIMRSTAQKDESSKQKMFEWNPKCQAAFDELKSYLSSPFLLIKAIDGEILYLYLDGLVPEDKQVEMKLRKKASRYTLVDGVLYKRSFALILLRCLNPYEAEYTLREVEAQPLSSLTSKKVEDFVFGSIICRYGIPNQTVADNGTQFNCSFFRDFCSSYEIKLQFISVYHPESNGMVESV
ncbi:hypothetical protein SLEP1_g58333 [Rubroshorea leprosula]|uniref:Integrase catalytic domain-containing protein n=1 Tax=Rubroshorea leprosula TaxID=152421 RepID=A0AAV5MTI7_9ROSI|nr:hypothetical protein SLEP1_g58333 [Rubroshorea leprosula]